MSELAELLGSKVGGRSARAIARAAQEAGHTLNHDTAARYLRGDHGTPDEATLRAFAEVLHIPMAELRRAANLPWESTSPYVPPPEASRLTRRQRLAVDEIIRAMLDTRADAGGRSAAAPVRKAARRGRAEPPVD
jgi:transcriptional regulator with XRE-family HTH domain